MLFGLCLPPHEYRINYQIVHRDDGSLRIFALGSVVAASRAGGDSVVEIERKPQRKSFSRTGLPRPTETSTRFHTGHRIPSPDFASHRNRLTRACIFDINNAVMASRLSRSPLDASPDPIVCVANDGKITGLEGVVELHEQDESVLKKLDGEGTNDQTWKRMSGVANLHHNLDTVHRIVLRFRLNRDDDQVALLTLGAADMHVVNLSLPHPRDAFSDVALEVERRAFEEAGEEIVVSENAQQPLFIDLAKIRAKEAPDWIRSTIRHDRYRTHVGIGDERRVGKRQRILATVGDLEDTKAMSLNLFRQNRSRLHPVDDIWRIARLESHALQLRADVFESEGDARHAFPKPTPEDREQHGAVDLAAQAVSLYRSCHQQRIMKEFR